MSNNELPNGWINAPIGDICELINGRAFKPTEWKDSGFPIIRIQNLNNANATFNYFDGEVLDKHKVKTGNLLFAWSGTPGTSFGAHVWKGSNAVLNQHIFKIDFSESLISKNFFRYAINQKLDELIGHAQGGVGLRHVTKGTFEKTKLAFPPLAEQKEIAARLDDLLAQVDTLKTRLDSIPNILKRFRQSVLAEAVSGKLTEEWREGKQLVKFKPLAIEIGVFRSVALSALPDSWQWLRFDQVAIVASNLKDPLLTPDAIHIAPNHIESETGKLFEYATIAEDNVTSAKHGFCSGQIIYSKIRPYLCKVTIVDFDGLCSADMYPINSEVDTRYLFRWMLSSQFTNWASNAESRSVLPKINQKDLGKIPVPVPSLEEQTEIVRRVEELFAFADQVEQQVKAAQQRVNHLTQAILAKAFRGELTAQWREQNPDLISGENSAAALLARIKTEKKK